MISIRHLSQSERRRSLQFADCELEATRFELRIVRAGFEIQLIDLDNVTEMTRVASLAANATWHTVCF
jgi:hypothetical protein